jgi:flap endonuclease-1
MTSRLTRDMVAEAKELLRLMGVAIVEAPSEAEAHAAHMARRGDAWAAASKDRLSCRHQGDRAEEGAGAREAPWGDRGDAAEIRDAFGPELDRLRLIFIEPEVRDDYNLATGRCDVDGIIRFMCDEHAFKRDRVMAALDRAFGPQKLF